MAPGADLEKKMDDVLVRLDAMGKRQPDNGASERRRRSIDSTMITGIISSAIVVLIILGGSYLTVRDAIGKLTSYTEQTRIYLNDHMRESDFDHKSATSKIESLQDVQSKDDKEFLKIGFATTHIDKRIVDLLSRMSILEKDVQRNTELLIYGGGGVAVDKANSLYQGNNPTPNASQKVHNSDSPME